MLSFYLLLCQTFLSTTHLSRQLQKNYSKEIIGKKKIAKGTVSLVMKFNVSAFMLERNAALEKDHMIKLISHKDENNCDDDDFVLWLPVQNHFFA